MTGIIAKLLTQKLIFKLTKIIIIAILEILVSKTDNKIDDELLSKIKEALNNGTA